MWNITISNLINCPLFLLFSVSFHGELQNFKIWKPFPLIVSATTVALGNSYQYITGNNANGATMSLSRLKNERAWWETMTQGSTKLNNCIRQTRRCFIGVCYKFYDCFILKRNGFRILICMFLPFYYLQWFVFLLCQFFSFFFFTI